jgi:hypothetical protein
MVNALVLVLIFVAGWTFLFPEDGLALIAEMKRQLRLSVIRRAGAEGEKELARSLHDLATKQNIDPKLVDQVLAEHHGFIVERLGSNIADRILSNPDGTEHIT